VLQFFGDIIDRFGYTSPQLRDGGVSIKVHGMEARDGTIDMVRGLVIIVVLR
jgi:hypothetical protein